MTEETWDKLEEIYTAKDAELQRQDMRGRVSGDLIAEIQELDRIFAEEDIEAARDFVDAEDQDDTPRPGS